ncbi:50S ribosomal protein L24, partial [Anaerotignum lactatifermentans]|uniref:50S ribosomal protein L24 n=1 Tax=Anaerotignum lactatifermentans TaxID=160404 RepID=UPI003AB3F077
KLDKIVVNMVTKHTKPSMQNQQGGIVKKEGSIHASNVMYLHNGKATRLGAMIKDGKKVRVAKKTGEVID